MKKSKEYLFGGTTCLTVASACFYLFAWVNNPFLFLAGVCFGSNSLVNYAMFLYTRGE